ncbi:MAG: hypothetical protein NZ730_09590 [Porticoccaceae bacterium]|nr:hypothetical protein [Porticoccaceae bacterium]
MITQITPPTVKEGQRFDWHSPIDADFITSLADSVLEEIYRSQSTRGITKEVSEKRLESRTTIAIHLLSALYNAHTVINSKGTPTPVSVPRDTNLYSEHCTHPLRVPYSYRYFDSVYQALKALGWIKVVKGQEGSAYTRIYARGELAATFDRIGLRWFKQTPNKEDALIVLRTRVESKTPTHKPYSRKKYTKITLDTPDTPETHQMAANLYRYNKFLTNHCIAFDLPDSTLYTIAKDMAGNKDNEGYNLKYLDFSRVQLRRIFSRGDMSLHGRFYGGWWQSIPSKEKQYRTHITIDGHRTCEIDYSAVCLRIVYALQGISIDPKEDLYNIGLPNWQGSSDPRRQPVKTYINAIMNDEEGGYRLDKEELGFLGMTHKELHALVLRRHNPIREELIASIGLKTQLIDSQIAEDIMGLYLRSWREALGTPSSSYPRRCNLSRTKV